MRQRHTLTERFSTFLQFDAERTNGWAIDPKLHRSIQNCLKALSHTQILSTQTASTQIPDTQIPDTQIPDTQIPDTQILSTQLSDTEVSDTDNTEQFLAVHWHRCWQQEQQSASLSALTAPLTTSVPLGHLSAYLQETCYWSTYNIMRQLQGIHYSLADCFQVAIAAVPKILHAKDPDRAGSLKTYASYSFGNVIRDFLRQHRELHLCTEWGLLLKLSRKRLKESLQMAGLGTEMIEQRILAWTCFESVYLPTKQPGLRKLPAPTRSNWQAIAQLYNQQRHQLAPPGAAVAAETLEQWLHQCVKSARAYLNPAIDSLNVPRSQEDTGELQDSLVDQDQQDLLQQWVAEEEVADRQVQYQQMQTVLMEAIAALEPMMQELLALYYQQRCTQQQIAQALGIQQYTVSRKLAKAREKLLFALTQWSQETLHIQPTSTVIKDTAPLLDEWLAASGLLRNG